MIRTEVFVTERVLLGDLVALQRARETWPATDALKLKYSTQHLAHDLRRQLNTKGTGNAIPSQVPVLRLAIDVHSPWVREHVRL